MTARIERIMHRTRALRTKLLELVTQAEPEHLAYHPEGRWSVRDILIHLGNWEEEAVTYLRHMLRGEEPPTTDSSDINKWNAEALARYAELDAAGAVEYLNRVRYEYEEAVALITADHMAANRSFLPLLLMSPDHEAGHLYQVREVLARAKGDLAEAALNYLGYARARILTRINLEYRSTESLEWRAAPDKWSVRDNLIHLAIWDRWLVEYFAAVADERQRPALPVPPDQFAAWNDVQVGATRHLTLAEVLHEFGAAREALEAQIRRFKPAHFDDRAVKAYLDGWREHEDHHMHAILKVLQGWRAAQKA